MIFYEGLRQEIRCIPNRRRCWIEQIHATRHMQHVIDSRSSIIPPADATRFQEDCIARCTHAFLSKNGEPIDLAFKIIWLAGSTAGWLKYPDKSLVHPSIPSGELYQNNWCRCSERTPRFDPWRKLHGDINNAQTDLVDPSLETKVPSRSFFEIQKVRMPYSMTSKQPMHGYGRGDNPRRSNWLGIWPAVDVNDV